MLNGAKPFYDDMNKQHKASLDKTVEAVYEEVLGSKIYPGKKYIALQISATTTDGVDAVCPLLRYILN